MSKQVWLETIIGEDDDTKLVREAKKILAGYRREHADFSLMNVPSEATRSGVPQKVYNESRMGLTGACADLVCVILGGARGKPVVSLIKRAEPPFKACWWPMGGALFNGLPIGQFLFWKLFKEGGMTHDSIDAFDTQYPFDRHSQHHGEVAMIGYLGTYRTVAEDTAGTDTPPCDTINVCYAAIAQPHYRELFRHDSDHMDVWFANEANLLPVHSCGHWYPRHVARRALKIVERAL